MPTLLTLFNLQKPTFPQTGISSPHIHKKTLAYYRDILLHHQSIVIKPIPDKNNPNITIYHSFYIHNIVSLKEWGHPSQLKELPNHPAPYSYYDYIDAFSKVLYYENETFSHSWFLSFDHKFKSQIPSWFLRWWSQHGATPELLPSDLSEQVNYFKSVYPTDQHTSKIPTFLLFMAKYKVPWIFKWRYHIQSDILTRQMLVKWWDTYKHQRVIDQVKQEFPVNIMATPIRAIHPSPPEVSTIRLGSPSPSIRTSKSKTSKSKSTKLLELAQQLIAQASQASDSSSEDSVTSKSPYDSLFQDAQDPFAK